MKLPYNSSWVLCWASAANMFAWIVWFGFQFALDVFIFCGTRIPTCVLSEEIIFLKLRFQFAVLGKCVAMKEEIAAAVFFLARLVKRYGCLDNDSRERFAASLTSLLFENYKNHWHPSAPARGQAYRSVIQKQFFFLIYFWLFQNGWRSCFPFKNEKLTEHNIKN